jgi:hypothetical protein
VPQAPFARRWLLGMPAGERLLREAASSGSLVDLSGRRRTLPWLRRLPGYFLDAPVGYGGQQDAALTRALTRN